MIFSAVYKPTALFSLRDSNSTSSGAKSLFLPSPYAIKMALINQAISLGGVNFNAEPQKFHVIRDLKINFRISGNFCVNNCLLKIQKKRGDEPFKPTVGFREYLFLDSDLEIIFETNANDVDLFDKTEDNMLFLKKYLCTINQLGKRGCFFQFVKFNDNPLPANVLPFEIGRQLFYGILQEYDDFDENLIFDNVNSYSESKTKRVKKIMVLPIMRTNASKSYTTYKVLFTEDDKMKSTL